MASTRWRSAATAIAIRPPGAKSDAADAKLLADLVRTDAHNHRPLAGDSDEASAIRVLARAHQGLVWTRQRQVNGLRSALRDYFPGALSAFGTDLASADALAILAIAPTPQGPVRSRAPGSPRPFAAAAASATWSGGRARSRRPCAPSSPKAGSAWPRPSAPPAPRAWPCSCRSTSRSPSSSERSASILIVTRTPRSCAVLPDSARSSAPGCSASSGMTRIASPMLEAARPTREPPRSPRPRAAAWSCWRGWRATGAWPMHVSAGRSARSPAPRCSELLRHPARPRPDALPGHPPARQPLGRDPPRLSGAARGLPRGDRLVPAGALSALGRLTLPTVGCLGALQRPPT